MVCEVVDPGRHLAGLPGRALDGVVEELHDAAAEEFLRPSQILADVVGAGAREAAEDAEEDAAEGDLVPVVQQMGLALALLQAGIQVLACLAVPHRLEPGEMVDAAGAGVELSGWDVEDAGHLLDAVKDPVAETHHAHVREPGLGLAQLGERVGVVEEPRVRTMSFHRARDVHAGAHVAERMEKPARAAVLAVDLREAEGARNVEVLGPVEVAVQFDGHDDRVGSRERVGEAGRDGQPRRAAQAPGDGFRVALHPGEFGGVQVHEDDVESVLAERVAQKQVADGRGSELAAPGADQDDLSLSGFLH